MARTVSPDFEKTWKRIDGSDEDTLEVFEGLPFAVEREGGIYPAQYLNTIYQDPDTLECWEGERTFAARDPDGAVWVLMEDIGRRREWDSPSWTKVKTPTEDQRRMVERIDELVGTARANLNEAVRLAKEAGVVLRLEEEFGCQGLTNVELDGSCWETSYC